MQTITGYKKINNSLKPIYKDINNCPKVRHTYINNKLWIFGAGTCFNDLKTAEKSREKKFEKLTKLNFFEKIFYANIPKYCYKEIIDSL
jgi:hypothetical protein